MVPWHIIFIIILSNTSNPFQRLVPGQGDDVISSIRISVADPEAPLSLSVDESYNLTVGGEAIEISGVTRFGIIRGIVRERERKKVREIEIVREKEKKIFLSLARRS